MTDVVSLIGGRIELGTPILELVNETIPLKIKQADSDIAEVEAMLLTRAKNT